MTETFGEAGARLWASVAGEFELAEHERTLLRQACRTVDLLEALQAALDESGPLIGTAAGLRVHPAAVELRAQRIALARLVAALRIPVEDETGRTQRRSGARGVYRLGVA